LVHTFVSLIGCEPKARVVTNILKETLLEIPLKALFVIEIDEIP
jgi:hypothetical protein